jgi:putative ABC transport system permease protein
MLKNYLTVGIRNILKYRVFSFINIFGLSTAMAVCMLIILMLADQHRYDQFNTKKGRIYRLLSRAGNSRQPYATTPFPLASALKAEYPIIQESTVLSPEVGGDATFQQRVADMRGYFASPSFFKLFDFELEQGDKTTALSLPNSMVISQMVAHQLFGDENPIGKTIEFSDRQLPFPQRFDGVGSAPVPWGSYMVTGVIDEARYKSHLQFDVLVSASSREALYASNKIKDVTNDWEWYFRHYTYVLLDPGKDQDDLAGALNDLVAHKYANLKSEQTKGFKLSAQKLTEVQLDLLGNDTNNRLPRIGY